MKRTARKSYKEPKDASVDQQVRSRGTGSRNSSASSSQVKQEEDLPAKRKRPTSDALDAGSSDVAGNRRKNLAAHTHCKICLLILSEPCFVVCGHTFCRECITQHLMFNPKCPICETNIDLKKSKIVPNYTAAAILENLKDGASSSSQSAMDSADLDEDGEAILTLIQSSDNIKLSSIRRISEALKLKAVEAELNDEQLRNILLHEFLDKMIDKREYQVMQLQTQLEKLKADKQKIKAILSNQFSHGFSRVPDSAVQPSESHAISGLEDEGHSQSGSFNMVDYHYQIVSTEDSSLSPLGFGQSQLQRPYTMPEQMIKYRRRLHKHFSSLESCYFNSHSKQLQEPDSTTPSVNSTPANSQTIQPIGSCIDELDEFSQVLKGMSQFGDMKRLATLNYNVDTTSSLSIVSSIEFDKDGEFFVIAGVTKKIKLYNYNDVINNSSNIHYPVEQLQCNSKISNVSWNPCIKNLLASSDYDGTVQLWDTMAGKVTRTLKEHEKRCWTVQFNNVDPHLMASGSDDAKVKLWCVTSPQSICTIDAKVNVCCVYFSPKSRNHLVFGSADHCVHLYDIRVPSKPLNMFRGHRKAVSYVKYCNESEVVSASTDSNLRVWDVNSGKCLQTMRGHQNEKNFVGLATDGNHVVCGSENNQLYLYYKSISEPLMSFDFASKTVDNIAGASTANADELLSNISPLTPLSNSGGAAPEPAPTSNDFVSAVCWKKNTNVIVAANSQGTTHILQLQ